MIPNRFLVRVWDCQRRKYVDETHPMFHDKWSIVALMDANGYDQTLYILEQCTDVIDDNDLLIYEGDLVWNGEHVYVVRYDDKHKKFGLMQTNTAEFSDIDLATAKDLKVIGNIHEGSHPLELDDNSMVVFPETDKHLIEIKKMLEPLERFLEEY